MKELYSDPFDAGMLQAGRWSFSSAWADAKRWDLDTPKNTYRVVVRLCDDQGRLLDESLPIRFGFREFWIDGRNFSPQRDAGSSARCCTRKTSLHRRIGVPSKAV